jgi:phosphoribosylanthranilate isomerase
MSGGGSSRRSRPERTLVKICGITRMEDAELALEAGADWLGFVLYTLSPRAIRPEDAARIVKAIPSMTAVAVTATPNDIEAALDTAVAIGAQRLQIHAPGAHGWAETFPERLPLTLSIGVTADGRLESEPPDERHLLLLDTADDVLPGGTGRTFPWEAAVSLAARRRVMLAGGLDAANVGEAIRKVRPFGVDASSRLESSPGKKDPAKVRAFIEAVRRTDRELARE